VWAHCNPFQCRNGRDQLPLPDGNVFFDVNLKSDIISWSKDLCTEKNGGAIFFPVVDTVMGCCRAK